MALLRDQMKQELVRKQRQNKQPPGYRQMEAGAPPQAGQDDLPTNATPEEQAIYEKVVLSAQKILYDKEANKWVMKMLSTGVKPSEAVSSVVALLIKEIDDRNNGAIPETVILPAAMEIMDFVAELAETAGLFELTADMADEATKMLVTNLGEHYGVNPEEIQQFLMQIPPDQFKAAAGEAVRPTVGFVPGGADQEPVGEVEDEAEEMEAR